MKIYSTRTEAIQYEVINPIESGEAIVDDFDIDAIADQVISIVYIGTYGTPGFRCVVEPNEFWQIVQEHAL